MLSIDGTLNAIAYDFSGNRSIEDINKNNQFEVEFCTGLQDKNGKLIYEGDIVKDIEGYLGVVEFCDVTAKFIIKFDDYSDFERDNCFELNIVGNIHENADLLGEE